VSPDFAGCQVKVDRRQRAGLAGLCSAGDALRWIKAVCSKFKRYRWNWRVSGLLGTPGIRLGGRLPGAASSPANPDLLRYANCA